MKKNPIPLAQSLLYAQDLANLYRIERAKQAELEKAFLLIQQKNERLEQEKLQMLQYAEDFRQLYQKLLISHNKTEQANLETIYRLSVAAEFRDGFTGDHLRRISRYCRIIAEAMGMEKEYVRLIEKASPMHDIGKIGIPDSILLKPGKHSHEERQLMEQHTLFGKDILSGSESPLLQMAESIALTHHERFDGSGYPNGIQGEDIPLEGRIVMVADVFDALTSERSYKTAYSVEKSLAIMADENVGAFDPQIYSAFISAMDKIDEFRRQDNGLTDDKN